MSSWHEELAQGGPRRGVVSLPWRPSADVALELRRGDRVRRGVGAEESPGWRLCTAEDGVEGWIHEDFLDPVGGEEALLREDSSSRELSLDEGERVWVHRAVGGWLWVQVPQGAWGWIPEDQVRPD